MRSSCYGNSLLEFVLFIPLALLISLAGADTALSYLEQGNVRELINASMTSQTQHASLQTVLSDNGAFHLDEQSVLPWLRKLAAAPFLISPHTQLENFTIALVPLELAIDPFSGAVQDISPLAAVVQYPHAATLSSNLRTRARAFAAQQLSSSRSATAFAIPSNISSEAHMFYPTAFALYVNVLGARHSLNPVFHSRLFSNQKDFNDESLHPLRIKLR